MHNLLNVNLILLKNFTKKKHSFFYIYLDNIIIIKKNILAFIKKKKLNNIY